MSLRRLLTVLVGTGLLNLVVGCGASSDLVRHPVAGAVLLDGRPLEAGTIRLIPTPTTRGPAVVAQVEDGFYELARWQGPVAGEYRVEIESAIDLPFAIDDEAAYAEHVRRSKGKSPLPMQPVPPKFNRESQLRVQVTDRATDNKFDFQLTTALAAHR